jgi:hypothetical protein
LLPTKLFRLASKHGLKKSRRVSRRLRIPIVEFHREGAVEVGYNRSVLAAAGTPTGPVMRSSQGSKGAQAPTHYPET